MTLTQIQYVLAVNEFRHFKRASSACHISQPTLSMQIQKLEDSLGIVIFDRSKSPVVPTREGLIFIKQAKVAMAEFNKIESLLMADHEQLAGDFKLAVIPTLSPFLIPLFAKKFNDKYPAVNLTVEERKTEEIVDLLGEDKIDGGILVTPLKNDKIVERTLYVEPFYVYASGETKIFKKRKINEADLSLENIWLLNEGHCFRNQVLKICHLKLNSTDNPSKLTFQSGNLETLKNMVDSSGGYTLLPEMMAKNLSVKDKKKLREFEQPIPSREVSLVHSRIFLKEKILNALETEIIDVLPESLKTYKKSSFSIIDI